MNDEPRLREHSDLWDSNPQRAVSARQAAAARWRESALGTCTSAATSLAQRLATTGNQLGSALGHALTAARAEQWFGQERAARPVSEQRVVGWLRATAAPRVSLKLRRAGWAALAEAVDPARDALVLTYGSSGLDTEPRWLISRCPRLEIPPEAVKRSFFVRLRDLVIIIPQKELIAELNGKVLLVGDGELSLE